MHHLSEIWGWSELLQREWVERREIPTTKSGTSLIHSSSVVQGRGPHTLFWDAFSWSPIQCLQGLGGGWLSVAILD